MDRLAEQVVAWHNRHPLAKRITVYDVHTMGLVALPFMRSGMGDTPMEPVLTDEVSDESLAAAWDAAGETDDDAAPEANPQPTAIGPEDETRPASHQQRAASAASAKPAKAASWWQRLNPLRGRSSSAGAKALHWPVFSERFIPKLSPRQVAAFALKHGYASPPRGPEWPQRVVAIDEVLMERGAPRGASGAWPYEIYLLSAGIDAGKSRSRVLAGMGPNRQSAFLGKRCWSLPRLGLLALVLVGIGMVAAALLQQYGSGAESGVHGEASPAASSSSSVSAAASQAQAPAAASTAASEAAAASALESASAAHDGAAPASQALASATASAVLPSAPAQASSVAPAAASAAPLAASTPAPAEAVAASAVGASQTSQGAIPNIRPQLSRNVKPPLPAASKAEASTAARDSARKEASKPSAPPTSSSPPPAPRPSTPATALEKPQLQTGDLPTGAQTAASDGKRVALVGPGSNSKADAEALLARMLAQVQLTMGKEASVQAQVFKTPEGWRPAVWPFVTREQAQLINATLIARGLHTKAIDF